MTSDSGQPVVTFERVPHDQIRIEASVDDGTGIVKGFLTIDDREPADLLERAFVVPRDAGPIAQILDVETLLIVTAELAEDGQPPFTSDALPPGAETARGRRQLLDELLFDRP